MTHLIGSTVQITLTNSVNNAIKFNLFTVLASSGDFDVTQAIALQDGTYKMSIVLTDRAMNQVTTTSGFPDVIVDLSAPTVPGGDLPPQNYSTSKVSL